MTKNADNRKPVAEIAAEIVLHWVRRWLHAYNAPAKAELELEAVITAALQAERDRAEKLERERDEALRVLEPFSELFDKTGLTEDHDHASLK